MIQAIKSGRMLAENSRPQNVVYSGILAASIVYGHSGNAAHAAACYGLLALLYALAVSFNNIRDLPTDKINKRFDNPLVRDADGQNQVWIFMVISLAAVGLLQFFLRQPESLLISVCYLVLAMLYSHPKTNIMSRGLLGTFLLTLCYGSLPFLLGALQHDSMDTKQLIAMACFQVALLTPIVLAKDYKDLEGDRLTGKRTPLVRYGRTIVLRTAMISSVIISVIFCASLIALESFDWTASVLAVVYPVMVFYLHARGGKPGRIGGGILMATALFMSWSLLKSILS